MDTVCTCLPGATLWLDGPARHAMAEDLAMRLRADQHRRVEVLDAEDAGVPCEHPHAAAERIGLVAEILARNGILAVVLSAAGPTERDAARARHQRAGTAFLELPAAGPGIPAPSADALLALLAEHGLVLAD
ncbi:MULTISPECIES: hypothetical protein [unclassified Kitasatospora]|uniref:hypothetical protein n=1 Tax=unclassified Kitasatospora TaxID=2633591 RepID=UPI00070E7F0B|nr:MULTISPECIES: hypothetical protein [unclassified Kitasatospora]KQV19530.1 hypothetical protein ASC99_22880 [Kitasatospora sp. Root107]KRB72897.1 hypothetical protein ASE03_21775 [Kitasatospora sp. Root187]